MKKLSLIVEQLLAPIPGGTGRYTAQIEASLAERCPSDWVIHSYCALHRDVAAAKFSGVNGPHRFGAGPRALSVLWEHGCPPWPRGDVVHALTPLLPVGRAFWRRPLVVTVHDTVPWTHPETLTARGVSWHRRMIGLAVREAASVVVPTHAVRAELLEIFPKLQNRVRVIHMGVSSLRSTISPEMAKARRAAWGLPDRYVLSLSTLEPRKGLDLLMDAMADSATDAGRTDLVVVGQKGWGAIDLDVSARRAGMAGGRIHAMGRISDADLGVVMAGATLLAVPSRAEGFGLPVLEGFAAGVPVVCSDAPALVEVAGTAAAIVPREDTEALRAAINVVLGDEGRRNTMRRDGVERAAIFSWDGAAELLWSCYQEVSATH